MTDEQQQLLDALGKHATDYRAAIGIGSDLEQAIITKDYLDKLSRLYATGWRDALGEINELPDDLLPADYLAYRSSIISDLEDKLSELTIKYHKCTTKILETRVVNEYQDTIEEMYRIGHWVGIPDIDSQLPDELMPPAYHERRRQLVVQYVARQ